MKKNILFFLFAIAFLSVSATVLSSVSSMNKEMQRQKKIWGLDLSHHQGTIDWKVLAKQKPDFIYFKATEGVSKIDSRYSSYRKEARVLHIPTGAYHYFSYSSPGYWQAQNFLKTAQLKTGDLPPVLDIEWVAIMSNPSLVANEAIAWLKVVENKLGVRPIIYCNYRFYTDYLRGKLKHEYPLWLSNYSRLPEYKCLFWQKTNNYSVDGIRGKVDYNIFMGGDKGDLEDILMK